ncbi:MAG TPA: hypothetical protein VD926_04045 [Acidimicrobiales bacterium]|nr:hypothetical protein [Acidimicrobiales bacterium]
MIDDILWPAKKIGIFTGTGTPEAVVDASPGALFLRTDGDADTTAYQKVTGTGNTGWRALPSVLTATAVNNFASLATGAMDQFDITVAGAALGDPVAVGCSVLIPIGAGLIASVKEPDTVSVKLFNLSGGAVDLASATFTVKVFKV